MELLEREGLLAAMSAALVEAASGRGSLILVSGEPGIGKTALVSRFARDRQGVRLLWGNCDDLSIPRPLGPLRDLTRSGVLKAALDDEAAPYRLHSLLLEELATPPGPTMLVIEDVHWADQATIDAIAVVGRRIKGLPALLVLTFRPEELGSDHPLPGVLETIRGDSDLYLQPQPLSRAAVASLAGADADRVYGASGGNPFYVTELIAGRPAELPPSVANAVLGRASRLAEEARRFVELVSMMPTRAPSELLDMVMPGWPLAAEEPERRQLLSVEPRQVGFRHELARAAVQSSVPVARRRSLHAQILEALLATGADPAEVAHHAEAAGNVDVAAAYALVAAQRAAAVESNREAFAHYQRAAQFADRFEASERAELFEELAVSAYTTDRLPEAFAAIERAIALNREVGDLHAVGRCTRFLSRCHWFAGQGEAARREAHAAIAILEPLGESVELARAQSGLSQLAMLADRVEEAVQWGNRAVALADSLGAGAVKAHALVNIGSVRIQLDPDDMGLLHEAHNLAHAVGDRHEAVRSLLNLAFSALAWARPETAWRHTKQAIAYAEGYQVDALLPYLRCMEAWLWSREGRWSQAERIANGGAATDGGVARLLANTVLTEIAVRRGDVDADERLQQLAHQADHAAELQRLVPVLQLEAERSLTTGTDPPVGRFESAAAMMDASVSWRECAVAAWASVVGIRLPSAGSVPEPVPGPFAAMTERDWRRAADAFGAVGWEYDRALMLSLLDDEPALVEALGIARRLGARPLDDSVVRHLRRLGLGVPPRPRDATLANPGGLTQRQVEVASLLAEGFTNKGIAERLAISTRTVEHHVEAVFAKLDVTDRRSVAARLLALGAGLGGGGRVMS